MLGPKRKAALVQEMERMFEKAWSGAVGEPYVALSTDRAGIAAVVDAMLAREEALVAPLVERLNLDRHAFLTHGPITASDATAEVLATYAASQADPPEPEPVFDAEAAALIWGTLDESVTALGNMLKRAREGGGK